MTAMTFILQLNDSFVKGIEIVLQILNFVLNGE